MTRTLTGFALEHDSPAKLLPGKSEAKGTELFASCPYEAIGTYVAPVKGLGHLR